MPEEAIMRTARIALLPVALAAALAIAAAAQEPVKREFPGVANYTRVNATIACGGATAPAAYPALEKDGFKAVVNLRLDSEPGADIAGAKREAEAAGLRYIHIPFDPKAPSPTLVDRFLAALRDPANSPTYIHCASANRVGALWLVKRVIADGWDVDKATAEAETIGLKSAELKKFALDYIAAHRKG
jgi:uncharacterized protein (TIGR01244 family)